MSYTRNHIYLVQNGSELNKIYLLDNSLYMELTKKGNKKVLGKNIIEFCVFLDSSNLVNIIFLESTGKLVHLYCQKNIWKKRIITSFDLISYKISNLKAFSNNESINVFLMISRNKIKNPTIISHIIINKNNWQYFELEEVIIDKYMSSYKIDMDNKGNIHLLYKSLKNDKYILFYKFFNSKYFKWSIPVKLSNESSNVINANIFCDTNNCIHVIWSSLHNKDIKINYLKKNNDSGAKSNWFNSKHFPKNIPCFTNPMIIQCNEDIKLIWKQNHKFYIIQKNLLNNLWSPIYSIELKQLKNFYIITYIGTCYKDFNVIKFPLVYGYFLNNELFIVGIDGSEQSEWEPEKNSIYVKSQLNNYIEEVKNQFNNKDVIKDLFFKDNYYSETFANLNPNSNLNEEIFYNLSYLYTEINNLKSKESEIMNLLKELNENYLELKKRIMELLNKNTSLNND